MLNTKEHFNQLDAIAITELDNETAATIQGGSALEVYRHVGQKDWLGGFNSGSPQLSSNANNQISSVQVKSGKWRLYDLPNYKGSSIDFLKPGKYNVPAHFNDRTTSLKKIG